MIVDTVPGKALRAEIEGYLPHRAPFALVDEVEVSEGHIRGAMVFPADSFFFAGHFPGYPVVPGVLLVESMAQCGGAGVKRMGLVPNGTFFLAKVKEARFRRQVRPGERFHMEIDNIKATPNIVHQRGVGYVDGEPAVEAEWLCIAGGNVA
ncbi:MAG TPA: 3-hydroxyacyl-ACP dehydratase FabZ family protein [Spirochaetia bacterium]|nr:3-hydroxyacyl-ACP dehydratase FabZ family protein [Spirochaetales bacterium]HRY74039.1 3-hydroxyacyl-ACP dehydratase FabZ family protein [Spirochaetia bacterium]